MPLLTGKQILTKQEDYLTREIAQHERDIITNQGKVQEDKELLERVKNTCLYCAEYIYPYTNEDKMEAHIKSRHPEEIVLENMESSLEAELIQS